MNAKQLYLCQRQHYNHAHYRQQASNNNSSNIIIILIIIVIVILGVQWPIDPTIEDTTAAGACH